MIYSSSRLRRQPQIEDDLKNEDDPKNEDYIKNDDDLKNEHNLENWPFPPKKFSAYPPRNEITRKQAGAELSQAQASFPAKH